MNEPNVNLPETWLALVQASWPGITDHDADMLLWGATSFPFGRPEQIQQRLKQLYVDAKGDPLIALRMAEDELDEAWEEYKRQQQE